MRMVTPTLVHPTPSQVRFSAPLSALLFAGLGLTGLSCGDSKDNDLGNVPVDVVATTGPGTSNTQTPPATGSNTPTQPATTSSGPSVPPNASSGPGPVQPSVSVPPQASSTASAETPSEGGASGDDGPSAGGTSAGAPTGAGGEGPEAGEEDAGSPPGAGGASDGAGGSPVEGGAGGPSEPASGGAPSTGDPFGPDVEGACTESQAESANANGSGPYDVVVETNSDSGINEGTIFRPAELGGDELFPIFVWGEGGCSQDGLSNAQAMAEIASHGYFVVADGTPGNTASRNMDSNNVVAMGEPLLNYVEWALNENAKPCSAYYHSLDATKVAANGFSCGGLMATGTAGDPRITTWGSTSSGTFSANQDLYDSVHTPVLIIEGGPSDIAYENGARDYEAISALGHPIMWFSKDIGHGGDLFSSGGGDFTRINLAWLNWWLKGDETESGKGLLVGAGCSYCTDAEWEVDSANLP